MGGELDERRTKTIAVFIFQATWLSTFYYRAEKRIYIWIRKLSGSQLSRFSFSESLTKESPGRKVWLYSGARKQGGTSALYKHGR